MFHSERGAPGAGTMVLETDIAIGDEADGNGFERDTGITGQPWLSLLVPVYNVRPFLEDCLRSILTQIGGDSGIELVLLDDASTDGSGDLARALIADRGSFARLLGHAENRGISATRNGLIDAARGRYVWFVDSDDVLLPGAVDALRAIVEAERPDVVICDYVREGEGRYPTFRGPERRLARCTETLVAGTFIRRRLHLWSRVWRRDLFDGAIRFPEGACFEDVATVPWLLLRAESFYYAAEPWVGYRARPGSIMARLNRACAGFDRRTNDDMARALCGFGGALGRAVPHAGPETSCVVARFVSREFAKIVKRLLRGCRSKAGCAELRAEMRRYRIAMEGCSPLPFGQVVQHYLSKGKIGRALELAFWLAITRPERHVELAETGLDAVLPEGA